ncbi:MAG: sugar phosphate isomerase/epimerase [Candidatus Pacebacteria bacterium]|nr:sugar phosphate isomerase/epimerase [Candidatus Paceibacterota bacterium]
MYFTGFADEASGELDAQIKATKELGWEFIETRALYGKNLAFIDDATFEKVCAKLDESGVRFNCFGSGIGNWATSITEPPDKSYDELRRAIPRLQRLGIKLVRIMSFPVPEEELADNEKYADEAFKRLKTIADMAEDAGIVCCHENCSGWASLSYEHTLRMLEAVDSPSLKLVFDTGNPVVHKDVRGAPPYDYQDSMEFYQAVKEHIVYVHIKDGYMEDGKSVYTFPGEGHGYVKEIVADLLKNGYDGGFSMEPHMQVVHHDKSVKSDDQLRYENYVEYGKRFQKIVENAKRA